MNKNSLLIGIGGAGKTKSNKMMLYDMNELQKHECLIIDCSDIKDTELNSDNIHKEEKTNE